MLQASCTNTLAVGINLGKVHKRTHLQVREIRHREIPVAWDPSASKTEQQWEGSWGGEMNGSGPAGIQSQQL